MRCCDGWREESSVVELLIKDKELARVRVCLIVCARAFMQMKARNFRSSVKIRILMKWKNRQQKVKKCSDGK